MNKSTVLAKIKENRIPLILSLIHWIITFFTDRMVFTVAPLSQPLQYIPCKILLLLLLFFCWRAILKPSENTKKILKFALLYFIPIIAVLIFKLPEGFLSNDESLIFAEASALSNYTWFSYLTTWYYIICMMLIPSWLGPILVKVAIQVLVAGYCVFRLSSYLDFRYGKFLYLPFLIPPVLAYTTSAHRIPVYFLLYIFLIFSLLMDKVEKKAISLSKLFWLLPLGAVLTQWRTEGIYLAISLPILLLLSYQELRKKKSCLLLILFSLLAQYIVSVPQNGLLPSRMDDKANNRMAPFYAYTVTNMYRNGLNLEENAEDLEKIDRYLDLSIVEDINRELGDINYEDVLILYYPGFTGVRENATGEDYLAYTEGCKNLFFKNPGVFFRTRIGALHYSAMPYRIEWTQGGAKGLALFLVSIVKTLAYCLYPALLLLVILALYSLIKRRWFTFFMTGGLCGHFLIVFVLAPASYFKYYFPIYMTMYFYLALILISAVRNHFHPEEKVSFLV
ncbi:MAG: hypothetical protein K5989_04040 [Lachnospiraceae bacterium]|nr:hypothetical protein [Lachnospiraceae bacterium]